MVVYIVGAILVVICLYFYGNRNYDYWKRKGVKHDKPYPFVGNSLKQLLFQVSFTDFFTDIYNRYPNERFVGVYLANSPVLIVKEPRDVQRVLVTDFNSFYLRGVKIHENESDPFTNHLFGADGDLWKLLRTRLTPAFTSGKLKAMFPLIIERAEKLQQLAFESAASSEEVDVKVLIARYTTDFIGACGFGIDMNAIQDENSIFSKLGKRIFTLTTFDIGKLFLKTMFPSLLKHWYPTPSEVIEMTTSLVNKIMKQRDYKPSSRNDFIDLLLEVKQKGEMVGESIEKTNPDGSPLIVKQNLDDFLLAAQAFVFFAAGFETSSTMSSYTLHLLAYNKDKQEKCQKEIDEVLKNHDDKLCYDAINEMKYLKMCFRESMRIFPTLGILIRKSVSKYTFPDSDLTIDKGIGVMICNHAMQMDDKHFENPNEFIPERFSKENADKLTNHVFLPFGEGPRACIGERLGLMQSLAGLASILHKFSVAPSKNSQRYPPSNPLSGLVQTVKGGIPLLLIPRKKAD